MEQTTLPTKTKIAIKLQDIIAILLLFPMGFFSYLYFFGFGLFSHGDVDNFITGMVIFFIFAALIASRFLILKRKKIGWWIAIITNVLLSLVVLRFSPFFIFPFYAARFLSPAEFLATSFFIITSTIFILLFLDRKNFFKIAS